MTDWKKEKLRDRPRDELNLKENHLSIYNTICFISSYLYPHLLFIFLLSRLFSGQITQDQSLFYYEDGQDVSTFSDPNHIPVFLDEIDNDTLSEAIDICGGDENIECLFDFSQTGNEALAQSTASTNNQNNGNEQVIGQWQLYYK